MSQITRIFSVFALLLISVFMVGQDSTPPTKNQPATSSGTYYYAMDPVTGTYRLYQANANALPPLRLTGNQNDLGTYSNRFGDQWFQAYSTTGLSADGKTLFIQFWLEKEISAAQFDPTTGVPTQPRKLGIQEVTREMSIEQTKMQFFSGEGKKLTKDEAGKVLKETKMIVLLNGAKPAAKVFSIFGKNTVIAVIEQQAVVLSY